MIYFYWLTGLGFALTMSILLVVVSDKQDSIDD